MSGGRTCSFCVMDESAPGITFDADGRCNFCRDFAARQGKENGSTDRDQRRAAFIADLKRKGQGKKYDCTVGVSGGVDSSYALYLAVKEGLRPLAVHLDNGWNSALSSSNIANLIKSLGVDLYTHVIDWTENRELQRAFFEADVVDIEMLMDNAMAATNFAAARRFGVRAILTGSNEATEGMAMPEGWNHFKWDARNIRAINRAKGSARIRTHPIYSLRRYALDRHLHGIEWIPFLDYYDYQKEEALRVLEAECHYKRYAHKHYESVFTRFYQGYILPEKFGIDKRRLHLSSLIVSGQETRENALKILESDPYPSAELKREDRYFVLKKFGMGDEEFDAYLARPAVPHSAYASEQPWIARLGRIRRGLNRMRTAIVRTNAR